MAEKWFLASKGKGFGPFSSAQLKQMVEAGLADHDDLVWQHGDSESIPASTIGMPPPLPVRNSTSQSPQPAKKKSESYGSILMGWFFIAVLVLVVFGGGGWFAYERGWLPFVDSFLLNDSVAESLATTENDVATEQNESPPSEEKIEENDSKVGAVDPPQPAAVAAEKPESKHEDLPPQIPIVEGWTYLASLSHVSVNSQFGRWSSKGEAVLGGQDGRPLFGQPLMFNGRHSIRGIYLHPLSNERSYVTYQLGRQFKEFRADVFVPVMFDHQGQPKTAFTFKVVGDKRTLWKSKPVSHKEDTETCVVSVAGVDELSLEIDCPGPNNWCLAAWAEPRLQKQSSSNAGMVTSGNVALASKGAIVSPDIRNAWAVNDGKSPDSWREYAKASLNEPIVLTLASAHELQSIRIELVGGDGYRYLVEVSADGKTYEIVQDRRNGGSWIGWQTVSFPVRRVKTIRLTGTYDAPNQTGIRVGEIEAYCTQ